MADFQHPDPQQRRQAIIAAVRQHDLSALPFLRVLAAQDSVIELRELAQKAVIRLEKDDPLQLDRAAEYYVQMLQFYKQQRLSEAAKALGKALTLDPTFAEDQIALKVATSATGLKPDEAIRALINAQQYGQNLRADHGGWQKRAREFNPLRVLFLLILIAMMGLLFANTNVFDLYRSSLELGAWREQLRLKDGIDYYLFVPINPMPAPGWGILVVLGDQFQRAEELIPFFAEAANQHNVVLVVPNFGEYPEPYNEYVTPQIDQILEEVRAEVTADPLGAVIFGYGKGGEIASLYAAEYYQVAAVITVNATDVRLPPTDAPDLVYFVMYGAYADFATVGVERAQEIEQRGNPIEFLVIPRSVNELNRTQIARAMQFVWELYR
ncbi:MAG: hypothetical protein MUF87_04580 [Anaerolineae bacterium]|jgi:hypothetical protein|nr:hypothetical protein [Anaerolineae bacterium]